MNIPRIVDAIGYIDDDLITAALEDPPRKRHNLMIKWMSVAACLALVMIAGILVPHFLWTATILPQRAFRSISQNAPTEQSQQKRTQLIVDLAELECESIRILAGNGMV